MLPSTIVEIPLENLSIYLYFISSFTENENRAMKFERRSTCFYHCVSASRLSKTTVIGVFL